MVRYSFFSLIIMFVVVPCAWAQEHASRDSLFFLKREDVSGEVFRHKSTELERYCAGLKNGDEVESVCCADGTLAAIKTRDGLGWDVPNDMVLTYFSVLKSLYKEQQESQQ